MNLNIEIDRKDLNTVIYALAYCMRYDNRSKDKHMKEIIDNLISQRAKQIHIEECKK